MLDPTIFNHRRGQQRSPNANRPNLGIPLFGAPAAIFNL
jgi:hypothetical protein